MSTLKNQLITKKIRLPFKKETIKILKKLSRILNLKKDFSVAIVDDKEIKRLNKLFLKKNRPTDCLAFPLDEVDFLGEVVVSLDTARKNSIFYNTSLKNEVFLYIIHGLLHLTGYDDHTPKEKKRMFKKQDRILKKINSDKYDK